MKIFNLLSIAAKNLKGKWLVLPVAGIAISVFCLCFAGAVLRTVNQEQSLPYELEVRSGAASLSDSIIAQIAEVSDVTAVTPVLQVPVSIQTGEYLAQLTLSGIDAAYLNDEFVQGGIFTDTGIMPYIVLSEAACKQFSSEENGGGFKTEVEDPQIDWLNADIIVQMGEGMRPVVSKISGILAGNEEKQDTPAAYISITSAKQLLQQSEQGTDYSATNVRITNIGCADSVSRTITALGLSVANANEELQMKWDAEMKEMIYLIVIGAFCLLCSAVLMAVWRKISILEQKEAFAGLQWIGMKDRQIGRLFFLQSTMIALVGIAVGIIISVSLPSFLPPEIKGTSIFTLPIPLGIAVLSSAICIIAGVLPFLKIRNSIVSDLI